MRKKEEVVVSKEEALFASITDEQLLELGVPESVFKISGGIQRSEAVLQWGKRKNIKKECIENRNYGGIIEKRTQHLVI